MAKFKPFPKPNKYGAKKQTYNGYSYHSKKEAEYAQKLDWRVKSGEVKSWTRQHRFDLRVNNKLICRYFIDFRAELTDGTIEYIEVKGFETDVWRLKWKLTQATWDKLTKGERAKLVLVK